MAENNKKNDTDINAPELIVKAAQEPIDINRMHIKLMIVCGKISGMDNAAHYLVRRGWETLVVGGIKEAFQTIGQFNPDFILFSVNLKTPKIFQIPTLIYRSFKIPVITFGEKLGTLTIKRLQDVPAKYSLTEQASGPSMHRKIKSILHEIQAAENHEDKKIFERQKDLKNTTDENAYRRAKKGYTFSAEDSGAIENQFEKKHRLYKIENEHNSEMEGNEQLSEEEDNDVEVHFGVKSESFDGADDEVFDDEESDVETVTESLEELVELAKAKSAPNNQSQNITSRTHAILAQRKDVNIVKKQSYIKANEKTIQEIEHFIIQSAREVAQRIAPPIKGLANATRCTVWPVLSDKIAGFIVVSHGGTPTEEGNFNRPFIEAVRKAASTIHGDFQIDEHLITNLEHVNLKQKIDGELFTATIPSGSEEIIIKFIEAQAITPTVIMEPKLQRARVDVSELVPELAPGVDLYLHMPKNNRYFMYLKMSGILSEKQKTKLLETNAAVFINSKDLEKYTSTFVKNTTVQKIRDLKKNKKAA